MGIFQGSSGGRLITLILSRDELKDRVFGGVQGLGIGRHSDFVCVQGFGTGKFVIVVVSRD